MAVGELSGGLTETRSYDCCGLVFSTDRTGVRTSYTYDSLRRVIKEVRNIPATGVGLSDLTYHFDPMGRRTSTVRASVSLSADLSTPANISVGSQRYNLVGQAISSSTPRATTSFAEDYTPENRRRTTTTQADGGTVVEVFRFDGSPESVSGTSAAPVKYDVGVDATGYFTQITKIGDAGATTEWTKTYVDFAGRSSKSVLSDGATSTQTYNAKGQLASATQPADSSTAGAVGVTALYQYNSLGQAEVTAIDLDHNGVIDFAGTDRVSKTVQDVATTTHDGVNYTIGRSTTSV